MVKLYKNFNIKNNHKNSLILIGNFDGVHSGHQKLFKLAKLYKEKYKIKIGVVNFDPMPKMFFNEKLKNFRLSNVEQKIKFLSKFKVDFVITKKFDKKFSKTKALNFISQILNKKLSSKFIFVSNNFRFGNKREGDVNLLKKLQKKYDYKLINPKPLYKKNKIISSTLIRKLIENGNLKIANQLLSRNWSIEGVVEKGRMMGRKIGFPTCNINIKNYVIPKVGVYAVDVYIEKNRKKIKGIANIGYRPTFNQKKLLLEVNLFKFSGNLYNKNLTINFTKFIRGETKFKNIDALKKQIKKDIKVAKR
jgi:riboflavin kinase/FMN adenylyltransferase